MRFAKLNKPPSKVLEKDKPPPLGGLIEGLRYVCMFEGGGCSIAKID